MRPLDTTNRHAVTTMRGDVVILGDVAALARGLSPEQALELAAWLIVGAELADPRLILARPEELVSDLAERIRAEGGRR